MRALITGINGFTGQYLQSELHAAGWEVWGLGTHPPCASARHLQADLNDLDALERAVHHVKPDAVVHLAAIAFVGHGTPDDFYHTNLIGTRKLLQVLAGMDRAPESVLLASSANIYGNAQADRLDERAPPNPANDYAVSKLAMEHMARLWSDRLPITIARPFNYTGIGQSEQFLLPKIVAHFRRKASCIELGNIDVWRDFSDVRAVVHAYRRLLETRSAGMTVNVCSGRTHSLREIIDMSARISGHEIEVRINPHFVRANEVRSLCGDPGLLVRQIGEWETPPLHETLRWMIQAP